MTQKIDLELRIKKVLEEPRDFPVIEITDKEFIEDLLIMWRWNNEGKESSLADC